MPGVTPRLQCLPNEPVPSMGPQAASGFGNCHFGGPDRKPGHQIAKNWKGGFHPQAVIWVIRLTSPHLP